MREDIKDVLKEYVETFLRDYRGDFFEKLYRVFERV